jgi:hypothetical protein
MQEEFTMKVKDVAFWLVVITHLLLAFSFSLLVIDDVLAIGPIKRDGILFLFDFAVAIAALVSIVVFFSVRDSQPTTRSRSKFVTVRRIAILDAVLAVLGVALIIMAMSLSELH